jgi:hypothetical protein
LEKAEETSKISYAGIKPITPLRFPEVAFEESENWSDK